MVDMGQVCCAGSRTYVQAGIYDEFVKRSADRAARRTVGSPFDPSNESGTLVRKTGILIQAALYCGFHHYCITFILVLIVCWLL